MFLPLLPPVHVHHLVGRQVHHDLADVGAPVGVGCPGRGNERLLFDVLVCLGMGQISKNLKHFHSYA
jgi:hypothetical protein